nr:ATP-dependent DNA helicase PIF1-like [Ipomoea batatas]
MMNLLYVEFPCHFVWCKSTKSWKPRKQLKVIGRLVTVNPTEGERYYLRMLLMNVRAPTSFESLKTVNGYFAETFREAAEKLGLLSGDSIIEQSLDEALLFQMPSSLRKLFAMLLIFCDLSNPRSLWIKYKSYMCQDFLRNGLHTIDESESLVLKLIANNLHKMGKNLYDYNLVDTFTELDIATTMTHEIIMDDLVLIPAVTVDLHAWKCKVIVVHKHPVRESRSSPGKKYKAIIFQDSEGNKVQAMLYDNEIDGLDKRLKLHCTYTISNASVKPATEFVNLPDPNYRNLWNITRRTMIDDVVAGDGININELVQPHITPFSDFYACLSSRQLIRIQIDLQLSQGKFPIVIAQGVHVNAFQGITLSTRYDTTIEVNPPGQHATVLNKWKDNNLSVIYKTIVDKTYLDSFLTLSNALQQPKCTFAEIDNELKQKPVAWVRGKLRMKNVGPLEYYIGCNYCNKTVNSIEGLKLHCLYCGQTDGLTVRRYKLNVEISDGSTIVQATLFNHDVHRLMLLVGIEMPTTVEDSEIFQKKLDAIEFVVGLRINALNEDHPSTLTYSVACICKDITRDTGEQQATPHARSSNIVEETVMVGNPTKRRLDFDESSKHAIDILEDATSKEKSASLDKGKKAKVD